MTESLPHVEDTLEVHTLSNGLTVALERLPYLRSVSAGMWIKTGSANEADDHAGVSHLLEHLFFKGTETRTAHDLMEAVECRGGHMNAFTSRDYTCLYTKTLDAHIGTGIEILADIIKNSIFADFEKERNVVLEEIASSLDVPEEYAHDLLVGRIWPNHPMGRPVAGLTETVEKLTLDDIKRYRDTWYSPRNMVFSVAGNFDAEAVLDQIREEFESMPDTELGKACDPPKFFAGTELRDRPIAQNHLVLGFPGAAVEDPERYVYEVMTSCVGGGSTSRLFERIREDEGLAYSIYAFQSSYVRCGMFGIYAAVAPENIDRTLELCFEELRKVRDEDLPEKEVDMHREQLKGGILMSLESTFNRMARMGRSLLYYGRVVPVAEVIDSVNNVGVKGIRDLTKEIFTADKCAVTVLGPTNGVPEKEIAL